MHVACAGEVQVSVKKETVVWKRGLLVVPHIVHQLLNSMQVHALAFRHKETAHPAHMHFLSTMHFGYRAHPACMHI